MSTLKGVSDLPGGYQLGSCCPVRHWDRITDSQMAPLDRRGSQGAKRIRTKLGLTSARPCSNEYPIIDKLVKSHKWDGTGKSSKCKACETGDPLAGWGVQAQRGQS